MHTGTGSPQFMAEIAVIWLYHVTAPDLSTFFAVVIKQVLHLLNESISPRGYFFAGSPK